MCLLPHNIPFVAVILQLIWILFMRLKIQSSEDTVGNDLQPRQLPVNTSVSWMFLVMANLSN